MPSPSGLPGYSKKEITEQHIRLVDAVMKLWARGHQMQDWLDPLSAIETLLKEARDA